ncbi:MAG: hypothetical protein ND895_09740 [Pyrinomonadaceae bacterium]|nr:hypothetical protein [Pyrinomonadaceae bacterium]
MNNPAANNEKIVKYLLGSLPEAETESFDEMSITDGEFAVALSAAEKDLIDAYVQGELTGATLNDFRSNFLASPFRRGKLDFAEALEAHAKRHQPALSETAGEELLAERPTEKKRPGWFAGKGFFTTPRLAWQWGFAVAAIAFLVAGSWLWSENMRLRQQISQSQGHPEAPGTRESELQKELEQQREAIAKTEMELTRLREERERLAAELKQQAPESQVAAGERSAPNQQPSPRGVNIASFILTPQMRGLQQVPVISIPVDTDRVSLQLELEPDDFRDYRVVLIDQITNRNIWSSSKIKATASDRKTLKVNLPASLLGPNAYVLRVTGVSTGNESEIVGDYRFRVVK